MFQEPQFPSVYSPVHSQVWGVEAASQHTKRHDSPQCPWQCVKEPFWLIAFFHFQGVNTVNCYLGRVTVLLYA